MELHEELDEVGEYPRELTVEKAIIEKLSPHTIYSKTVGDRLIPVEAGGEGVILEDALHHFLWHILRTASSAALPLWRQGKYNLFVVHVCTRQAILFTLTSVSIIRGLARDL